MTDDSLSDPSLNDIDTGLPVPLTLRPPAPMAAPASRPPAAKNRTQARIAATLAQLEELGEQLNARDDYDPDDGPPGDFEMDDGSVQADGKRASELVTGQWPEGFLLSIVVPVFNERETIRPIVARLMTVDVPSEIILVDDGSDDGTHEELIRMTGLPGVQVILQPINQGKGAAVRSGFARARGDVIMVQDADLEYDPRDIPRLVRPVVSGEADVVYGSRFLEARGPGTRGWHRFGNRLLTKLSNWATKLDLTDMETCYKVFRADVLKGLSLEEDRFGFEPEITAKVARGGHTIVELPVRYSPRDWQQGKKIGIRDGFAALYCIFRYWREGRTS